MPDGVTAMRLMREDELASGRRRTPILALTANAMEHQKGQYLASGADGIVAKPISLAGLVNALEVALTEARDGAASASAQQVGARPERTRAPSRGTRR